MTDQVMRDVLTADDRLDDVGRARMWSRLEDRIATPAPRAARWPFAVGFAACAAAVIAVWMVRRAPAVDGWEAPADATLTMRIGPHTDAALIGPGRMRVIGEAGDVTRVRVERGTLLAEFSGGPGRALHVEAPGMQVDVVGTLFAVEIEAARTCVSVAHGRVRAVIDERETSVDGGQQACTHESAPRAIEPRMRETLERHAAIVAVGHPAEPAPAPAPAPAIASAAPSAAPPPDEHPAIAAAEPHDVAPHDVAVHDVAAHDLAPHDVAPHVAAPHDVAAHEVAPHVAAAHAAAPRIVVPHVVAPAPAPEPEPIAPAAPAIASTDVVPAAPAVDAPKSEPPKPAADAPKSAPPKPAPAAPQPAPAPPSADELYRAAEGALARRDTAAADRALAELVATSPSSPLVGQALYERARIAYQRRAWPDARRLLDTLAKRSDPALAESGHYLTCRIAVDSHDRDAARCLADFRVAYPRSPHDRDVLGTLAQLALASGGCAAARPHVAELASRYPHSALAAAWRAKCPETP
jgi:TolA-binding protein